MRLNIHEAYIRALSDVYYNPTYKAAPRGLGIRERVDYMFTIMNPTADPIVTCDEERNKVIQAYTLKEMALYNSGTNKAEDFAKASSFWNKIANSDGTINSAYGYLIWTKRSCRSMDTQWEWARQSLINDKDTRQAFMRFSLPDHQFWGNKDQVCTMHGNFLIREDKLHLTIVMRSNDLVLGLVYDLPWFCSLMDKMVEELKPYYPTLTKGHYTHLAHSMHIYDRDEEKVKGMLGLCPKIDSAI